MKFQNQKQLSLGTLGFESLFDSWDLGFGILRWPEIL